MTIGYICLHCGRRYALDGKAPTEWRNGCYCSAICAQRDGTYSTAWVQIPPEYYLVQEGSDA